MAQPKKITDIARMSRLWHDPQLKLVEIATMLGVPQSTLCGTARREGLPPRATIVGQRDVPEVDAAEDETSGDSLRLAPSVEAAAAEVRAKWSANEEYNRAVTRVQPVSIQAFSFDRSYQ